MGAFFLIDFVGQRTASFGRGSDAVLDVLPGLVFGVVISAFLHRRTTITALQCLGYTCAATFSWFCAEHVAVYLFMNFSFSHYIWSGSFTYTATETIIDGAAGGAVYSGLLGVLTILVLRSSARVTLLLPVAIGTVAGTLALLIYEDQWWPWRGGFLAFLMVWHGAYAASLAPLLRVSVRNRTCS